ncbi:thioredoxin family protein [Puia sp.]|jgi:DNA-binding MarR family transcriptional regulator|uniref:thioredoxin family protein n=1 Tax=Puia sp. TaxID=2045100 RepID=UPI002F3EBE7B
MRIPKRLQPESETATTSRFASSLYFSSGALARATESLAIKCFQPTGLHPSLAFIVLFLLNSHQKAVSNSFLAKALLLSPSTMVRLVDRLVKKGLIQRFEYDGTRMLWLTKEAWDKFDLFIACDLDFEKKCRELLGDENSSRLIHAMNQATDIVRAGLPPGDCPNADEKCGPENRPLQGKLYAMSTPEPSHTVESAYLQKAISYETYIQLIDQLVAEGQTTGPDQSEGFIHYTVLNQQRMHRWDKTIRLLPAVEAAIRDLTLPQTWLVLTEAWCGDAAHSIPVLHALAALNPLITLRFLLRDENPELMDRYLTNGVSRSIPKLIALDTFTRQELFTWGPRPAPLQAIFMKLKEEGTAYAAVKEELQRWYNKDKSVTIQEEMAALVAATGDMGMTG